MSKDGGDNAVFGRTNFDLTMSLAVRQLLVDFKDLGPQGIDLIAARMRGRGELKLSIFQFALHPQLTALQVLEPGQGLHPGLLSRAQFVQGYQMTLE